MVHLQRSYTYKKILKNQGINCYINLRTFHQDKFHNTIDYIITPFIFTNFFIHCCIDKCKIYFPNDRKPEEK